MRVDFTKLDALGNLYLNLQTEFIKAVNKEEYNSNVFESNLWAYISAIHEEIRANTLIDSLNVDQYFDRVRKRFDLCYSELARALKIVKCPFYYKSVAFESDRFDLFADEVKFISVLYDNVWRSYFLNLFLISSRFNEENEVIKEDYKNFFWGRKATVEEMINDSRKGKASENLPQRLFYMDKKLLSGQESIPIEVKPSKSSNPELPTSQKNFSHRVKIFAYNYKALAGSVPKIVGRAGWIKHAEKEGILGNYLINRWYTTLSSSDMYIPISVKEIQPVLDLLSDDPEAFQLATADMLKQFENDLENQEKAKQIINTQKDQNR